MKVKCVTCDKELDCPIKNKVVSTASELGASTNITGCEKHSPRMFEEKWIIKTNSETGERVVRMPLLPATIQAGDVITGNEAEPDIRTIKDSSETTNDLKDIANALTGADRWDRKSIKRSILLVRERLLNTLIVGKK